MAKTFKSWDALQKAIQQEMKVAMEETVDKSFQDLHKNVDHFYDSPGNPTSVANPPPGYDRTGQLAESPEQKVSGGGNSVRGELKLDTTYKYVPSGRDTNTIYGYAENGGLLGNGGFWQRTLDDIEDNINESFGKRFDKS